MIEHAPDLFWERDFYGSGKFPQCPYPELASFVFRNEPKRPRNEIRILEIGCGPGNNLWYLAHEGFSVAGTDSSGIALEFARRRLEADGLSAELRDAAFPHVPFAHESFDFVLERAALCCVPLEVCRESIDEVRRVLKPGGKFLFCPYSQHERDFGYALHYSEPMIYDLFRNGWRIIQLLHVTTEDRLRNVTVCGEWKVGVEKVASLDSNGADTR